MNTAANYKPDDRVEDRVIVKIIISIVNTKLGEEFKKLRQEEKRQVIIFEAMMIDCEVEDTLDGFIKFLKKKGIKIDEYWKAISRIALYLTQHPKNKDLLRKINDLAGQGLKRRAGGLYKIKFYKPAERAFDKAFSECVVEQGVKKVIEKRNAFEGAKQKGEMAKGIFLGIITTKVIQELEKSYQGQL